MKFSRLPSLAAIVEQMNEKVVGQKRPNAHLAKAAYEHFSYPELAARGRNNVLAFGPPIPDTSEMFECLSGIIGVPYYLCDAATLVENLGAEGFPPLYVGRLMRGGSFSDAKEVLESGIIVVDNVDQIWRARFAGKQMQKLQKFISGTTAAFNEGSCGNGVKIDTSRCLFIFRGDICKEDDIGGMTNSGLAKLRFTPELLSRLPRRTRLNGKPVSASDLPCHERRTKAAPEESSFVGGFCVNSEDLWSRS